MEFAPLVNCRGLWTGSKAFADFPGAPRQTRTAMWLAIVTAGLNSELVFLLQSTGEWLGPNTLGGGWQQTIQLAIFATQMRSLLPSFLRPFENGPHTATLNITSARMLRPTASIAGMPGLPGSSLTPVRARVWVEDPCATPCMHLIVVNVLDDTPVEFTAQLHSPALAAHARESGGNAAAMAALNATRLFDADYNITLRVCTSGGGESCMTLTDFVPPGEANVYEIGCTGPRPKERNDGTSPPWQTCANRRVLCWDHSSQCGSKT